MVAALQEGEEQAQEGEVEEEEEEEEEKGKGSKRSKTGDGSRKGRQEEGEWRGVTFDSADLSDIYIGNGESVSVVQETQYMRSYATRASSNLRDVEEHITQASKAFGAFRHCLFRRKDVSCLAATMA
jgi:hypothetical protein